MKYKFFYICALLLYFSIGGFAQDKPDWITSLENNLKRKEAGWKIVSGGVTNPNGRSDFLFILTSAEAQARIKIQKFPDIPSGRQNDAKEAFAANTDLFNENFGKNAEKVKLENLGDEGFIWTNVKKDDLTLTWIIFRKNYVFAHISASSEDIARKFAGYVAEQIP